MKVFIIDDEQISLFLTQRMLVLEEVTAAEDVRTFLSAKEALHYLSECTQAQLPDIILLDINMPEMDGWQFLDSLMLLKPQLSQSCGIYILTSSLDLSDEEKSRDYPMLRGFIHKPIGSESIRALRS